MVVSGGVIMFSSTEGIRKNIFGCGYFNRICSRGRIGLCLELFCATIYAGVIKAHKVQFRSIRPGCVI